MLNRLSILVPTALLAVAGVAAAQQQPPQTERQTCDLMSREEMQLCLNTKPGDVSGARSVRCDQLARSTIEACLKEKPAEVTASAPREGDTAPSGSASTGAASGDSQRR